MPKTIKRGLAIIAERWKSIVGVLLSTLAAIGLVVLLRRFPSTRIPAAVIAACIFSILLLWLFPRWQLRSVTGLEPKDRFDRENEARKTLSQILGGLILLVGFYFTWQNLVVTRQGQSDAEKSSQENVRIASEGQITDRFTKAIAQLGDTKLEIRLGGIYALERIAKDSPKDHWPIMEVLTAYVREHAKKNPTKATAKTSAPNSQVQIPKPAVDIQAILTVIGRRTMTYKNGEDQRLDLHETDLSGADLRGLNFRGVDLNFARLSEADLERADFDDAALVLANLDGANLRLSNFSEALLRGAGLRGAFLISATLERADLSQAILSHAILNQADLAMADLTQADLTEAFLVGANVTEAKLEQSNLDGANLTLAKGLSPSQIATTIGSTHTILPSDIPQPKSWH
jgi:uncharacterized protein YjbI with pentapeptide repeats